MRNSNPILSNPSAFKSQIPAAGEYLPMEPQVQGDRMTLDDVIAKTGITMGILVISAAVSWVLMPLAFAGIAAIVCAIAAFITVMVVASRPKVPVAGVILYSVLEGVLIGFISKFFESYYSGIVAQAAMGTFVAAGATLFAYKFFNIRVTPQFRKIVTIATFAFVGVILLNLVLMLFGTNLGISGVNVSLLGVIIAFVGAGLAVLNLVLDFDNIERGVQMGAPANESWRAALGLTVTMVWLYIEILRILSYFRN